VRRLREDYMNANDPIASPRPQAELSPPGDGAGNSEAFSDTPHTALGGGGLRMLKVQRTIALKCEFEPADWKRLRELAWQAMSYRNWFALATWAQMMKLRAPTDDDKNVSIFVRARYKGELSSAVYSALENDVAAKLSGTLGRQVMAGSPVPQFRHADAISVRDRGIKITEDVNGFALRLSVQSEDCEGGTGITLRVAKGVQVDDYLEPILHGMATGTIQPRLCTLRMQFERYRITALIAFARDIPLPPVGERVAQLGIVNTTDKRLVLRTETRTIDYTHKLTTLLARKQDWDGLRRRIMKQIGRRKHGARTKREELATGTFEDWCKNHLHTWAAEIIDWCASQGVGKLVIADTAGGDWPAFQLAQYLKYKGDQAGMVVAGLEAASLEDGATERTIKAEVKKRQRRARKLGDAIREIQHQTIGVKA